MISDLLGLPKSSFKFFHQDITLYQLNFCALFPVYVVVLFFSNKTFYLKKKKKDITENPNEHFSQPNIYPYVTEYSNKIIHSKV